MQFAGNGQAMGTVQLPPGAQQGAYGVQMPLGGAFQPQQQPVQPTGQQVINANAGYSYGLEQLPPAPQPQQQPPFMGAQGNYGLTPQWQQPQGQGGYQAPQWQIPGQPPQPQQQPFQLPWQQQQTPPQGQLQAQPQQQPSPSLGLNTRLDGPGVPERLRGRTLGEALQFYSAMEGSWLQRQGVAQTPAQQSLAQMQPQQQAAPQQQQSQQPQGGQQQVNAWTNPGEFFGNLFEKKLEERLGPVIQHTQQQAVTQAYQVARGGVIDFQQLEPDLMQMLAGADPNTLANPATWIGAADIVRGRQMREGRYQPPQQQQMGVQQVQVPGPQPTQWGQNPAMMPSQPAGQQQVPNYGFFTEAPTAPGVSQFGGLAGGQPSQQDHQMAAKFGMPIQEWMAWKVGVSTQPQGQQQFNGGVR